MKQHAKLLLIAGVLLAVLSVLIFANYWQNRQAPLPLPSLTPQTATSSPTSSASFSIPYTSASMATSPALPTSSIVSASPSAIPSIQTSSSPSLPPVEVPPIFPSPPPLITLYPGEVQQYNGTNLAPIGAVYENAIAGTQYINETTYKLSVYGLVDSPLELPYQNVTDNFQSYQKVVTIYCVEGWNATILWQGVLVRDLINTAKPSPNATTVIFHASDGYTTALPLSYLTDNNILLAYKMNGVTIPPERGFPFQLVAESKFGYKWIKWVTGIELSDNANYLGYWESYGYSNDASLP